MAKKQLTRAPGKTQISISLSAALVKQIDESAARENRNRSNYIATVLEEVESGNYTATHVAPARRR